MRARSPRSRPAGVTGLSTNWSIWIPESETDGFEARPDLERRLPNVKVDHLHEERNPGRVARLPTTTSFSG
ncbi:MAG: hypothetical protein OES09_16920 [Gammaproteobacteria bacterium]|nr:hypothetical protein [Gammaproteobacteria bacterium]